MNFIQRLRFLIFGTPYVVLESFGEFVVRPVQMIGGRPYTTTMLDGCKVKLLPRGRVEGGYFVRSWEPATPDMNYYLNPPNE